MTGSLAAADRLLAQERVVAVIRHANAEDALTIARRCLAGGLRVIEVTLTVPDALAIIAELAAEQHDDVLLGAGTVLHAHEVELATAAGARFVVSPVTDPAVLEAGRLAGVLTVPGALTPTEIAEAHRRGARTVKLFPAGTVGPALVGAVASVLPAVRLLPTGGVAEGDVAPWLAAGSVAVGIGSDLARAYTEGGAAGVEALAARLARHADRPLHLAETAPDRSKP